MIVAAFLRRHHGVEFFCVEVAQIDYVAGLFQPRQRFGPDRGVEGFGEGMAIDVVDAHLSSGATEERKAYRFVMAGLVPAIPTRKASACPPKRDARHKAGHDGEKLYA